jgi:lipoprotein NlpD
MCRLIQLLLLLSACLLLVACSGAVRWEKPAPVGAPVPGPVPAPVPRSSEPEIRARPEWHTVRAGETLYAIAFRYALSADTLAAWNNLGDGTLIRVGQRLRLSPPDSAQPPAQTVGPIAAGDSPPRWQRPVPGPVLERYGESPLTASGIQLGGRSGDPVHAAAEGQVVYAGSGLVGYGELLIIKHNSAWLTAYGYNSDLLVREGERVSAGQPIARMGEGPSTGLQGRRSMLHFEIRRNGVPVDPLSELPNR